MQPEQQVEQEAVDDVGESVPVGEVLGILRAHGDAVPELHIAAFADPDVALKAQDERLRRDQKGGDEHARLPVQPPFRALFDRRQLRHVFPLAI